MVWEPLSVCGGGGTKVRGPTPVRDRAQDRGSNARARVVGKKLTKKRPKIIEIIGPKPPRIVEVKKFKRPKVLEVRKW
jgi:hypothetical protein